MKRQRCTETITIGEKEIRCERERNHKAHFVREVGRDSAGKIHLVEITWHGREWRELSK